jgi:hypothetical protein
MMWNNYMNPFNGGGWNFPFALFGLMMPFAILDIVLKGFGLWRSAKREDKWWFVAILLVNSLGILPGIYLLTHKAPKKGK